MKTAINEYKLCYVDGNFAYFTSAPLARQWGDDWDDAPYEHNAGRPYEDHYPTKDSKERVPHEVLKVAWTADYVAPSENHVNSPWSVQAINKGAVAWLIPNVWRGDEADKFDPIPAGTGLADFVKIIERSGGEVYVPRRLAPEIDRAVSGEGRK